MERNRRIRAKHKFTNETVLLYYPTIQEAQRRNPGLIDFEYLS